MIIVCEQCQTRFQLDDARIPARGARVRCSRCKHAFHIAHPGAQPQDVVEEAIAAVSEPAAPEPSVDLGVADDPQVDSPLPEEDEEQDWEFNEDGPSLAGQAAAASQPGPAVEAGLGEAPLQPVEAGLAEAPLQPVEAGLGEAPLQPVEAVGCEVPGEDAGARPPSSDEPEPTLGRAAETAAELEAAPAIASSDLELDFSSPAVEELAESPNAPGDSPESPLDDLGSPDEWDFLVDGVEASAPPDSDAPLGAPVADSQPEPEPAVEAETGAVEARRLQSERVPTSTEPGVLHAGLQRATQWLHAVSFALVGGMFLVGLIQVGSQALRRPGLGPLPTRSEIPGGHTQDVRLHFVDNFEVGPLAVVSGQYIAGSPGTLLRVQWSSEAGPIPGASALAGPALPERWLREASPETLARMLAGNARQLATAGTATAFQAVFRSVPAGATLLLMTGEPLAHRAGSADGGTPRAPAGAPPPAGVGATASRRPSPLPSSE